MSLPVRLMSAFIRTVDIAAHYPGGCDAFKVQHSLGEGSDALFCLISMSGAELESMVNEVDLYGFDTTRYFAIADMFMGPLKTVPYIAFTQTGESMPPMWVATACNGGDHRKLPSDLC